MTFNSNLCTILISTLESSYYFFLVDTFFYEYFKNNEPFYSDTKIRIPNNNMRKIKYNKWWLMLV